MLAPLPNTLFQRDNSAWIASGVTVNPMAKLARQRESVHTRAVYRYHPLFRDAQFERYYGDDDRDHRPATLEGGDLLVLAPGVVLIGMGERTTPTAVELLARRLFATQAAQVVVAVDIPSARATMHLDTVLTMVDVATFVAYPHLDLDALRAWRITPGADEGEPLHVEPVDRLPVALADALERRQRAHPARRRRRRGRRARAVERRQQLLRARARRGRRLRPQRRRPTACSKPTASRCWRCRAANSAAAAGERGA